MDMRKSVMVAAAAAFSLTLAACGEKGADAAKDTTAMAPAEATASNDQGGNDQGGNDQGGNDQGGNDQGGNDQGGNDQGGNDQSGKEQ